MTPNTSGKNFGSFLPKVGAGSRISYDHINKLSEAVSRNQINKVNGGLVRQSNSGTSIDGIVSDEQSRPWSVQLTTEEVVVRVGNVWTSATSGADIKKFIFPYNDNGSPIIIPCGYGVTCDIAGHQFSETQPYFLSFPTGTVSENKVVYIDATSGSPVVRYANLSSFASGTMVVPIAVITPEYFVVQIVSGDIWLRAVQRPFQVTVYSVTEGTAVYWRAKVSAGTVNNMIPKYNATDGIDDPTKYIQFTPSANIYFYLKLTGEPEPATFPSLATIEASPTLLEETITNGYILLAKAVFTNVGSIKFERIDNFIFNSLRAEAHRYTPTKVNYFYYFI